MGEQAAAVAARRAAREARLRLDTDRAARDGRIEEQVAAVILAQQRASAAVQVAADAQAVAATESAAADRVIGRSVVALLAERLTAAEVATVTGLAEKRIRSLARAARRDEATGGTSGPGAPGPAPAEVVSAPVVVGVE